MRYTGIVLFLVASAAVQAADTRVTSPKRPSRTAESGSVKSAAAKGATSKSGLSATADDRDKQVRSTLDGFFAAGSKAWTGRDFEAARGEFRRVLAMAEAPPHFRSHAHLRIAQTYTAEGNPAAAKAEFAKIMANPVYPEVHRYEAGECLKELERSAQGLPARDPEASRTKVPAITKFAAEFFVAPAGNDSNPGTRQKPFASLEKSRDAIRALKASGALAGPIAVRLLPGEYNVTKTLEFVAEDSGTAAAPIVYRADQPGTVVLYGGKRLSGFVLATDGAVLAGLPAEAQGKVFQCDLRGQGVDDLAPLQERGYGKPSPKATLELFFNGEPLTLARWPNKGFVNGGRIVEPGLKKEGRLSVFEYLDDRHARWTNAADGWLFGYFRHGWADRALKIQSIDPVTKRLACGPYEQGGFGMEPVAWFNKARIKYFAFNLLEELDQPGEWYLDRATGILYFYPPSDPAGATIEIGMLAEPMVALSDVAHVRFEGIVFDLSRANGMTIDNSEHCLIAGCTLKRLAGNGITMTGGRENGIFGCDLYSLGRRATEVIGGDRQTLTPARHFVENCWIHSFGRLDHTYVPAVQLEGCGNRVAHNLMGDCPSSVVRYEGNDHLLEYNRVYRTLRESEDQGAMETFGNPTYRGVVIRYNHFSDIGPQDRMEGPAGRAAIRLDDAISGMLVYGNIFHRAAQGFGGININGGRDNVIENNLFAECEKGITGGYNARNDWWQRVNTSPAFTVTDLYLQRYPELKRLGTEPGLNFARRNIFWKCGPMFTTYGKPSADKFELLDNVEYQNDDPGFMDATKGDFRLKPDAEIVKRIGFQPIPVNEIGLYEHPLRASWPVDMHGATKSDWSRETKARTTTTTTAIIKPWTLAERNGRQCLLTPAGEPFMVLKTIEKTIDTHTPDGR
jgi:hypothetical protein